MKTFVKMSEGEVEDMKAQLATLLRNANSSGLVGHPFVLSTMSSLVTLLQGVGVSGMSKTSSGITEGEDFRKEQIMEHRDAVDQILTKAKHTTSLRSNSNHIPSFNALTMQSHNKMTELEVDQLHSKLITLLRNATTGQLIKQPIILSTMSSLVIGLESLGVSAMTKTSSGMTDAENFGKEPILESKDAVDGVLNKALNKAKAECREKAQDAIDRIDERFAKRKF